MSQASHSKPTGNTNRSNLHQDPSRKNWIRIDSNKYWKGGDASNQSKCQHHINSYNMRGHWNDWLSLVIGRHSTFDSNNWTSFGAIAEWRGKLVRCQNHCRVEWDAVWPPSCHKVQSCSELFGKGHKKMIQEANRCRTHTKYGGTLKAIFSCLLSLSQISICTFYMYMVHRSACFFNTFIC